MWNNKHLSECRHFKHILCVAQVQVFQTETSLYQKNLFLSFTQWDDDDHTLAVGFSHYCLIISHFIVALKASHLRFIKPVNCSWAFCTDCPFTSLSHWGGNGYEIATVSRAVCTSVWLLKFTWGITLTKSAKLPQRSKSVGLGEGNSIIINDIWINLPKSQV